MFPGNKRFSISCKFYNEAKINNFSYLSTKFQNDNLNFIKIIKQEKKV